MDLGLECRLDGVKVEVEAGKEAPGMCFKVIYPIWGVFLGVC